MDLGSIGGLVYQWVITPLFWLILILIFAGGTFIILVIRKNRRLQYKAIEVVDLGTGKVCLNNVPYGWFGKKSFLKGLIWWGEEVAKLKTGEIIRDLSTEDYHEIDKKRGVLCYRDPTDQDILVPINRITFKNKDMVAEIAPSSYRDIAADIFNEIIKETTDFKERMIQFAGWALIVIFSLVAIIVIVQYVKSSQDKAANMLLTVSGQSRDACLGLCKDIFNSFQSSNLGAAVTP